MCRFVYPIRMGNTKGPVINYGEVGRLQNGKVVGLKLVLSSPRRNVKINTLAPPHPFKGWKLFEPLFDQYG